MKAKTIETANEMTVMVGQRRRDISLMGSVDAMPMMLDPETFQIIKISSACDRIIGYIPQEVMYQPDWKSYIHPDDSHIPDITPEDLTDSDIITKQYRIIHKDGRTRWVESQYMRVEFRKGQPTYLSAIIRDITKSKAA